MGSVTVKAISGLGPDTHHYSSIMGLSLHLSLFVAPTTLMHTVPIQLGSSPQRLLFANASLILTSVIIISDINAVIRLLERTHDWEIADSSRTDHSMGAVDIPT